VIACGGTTLTSDGTTLQAEVVWNGGETGGASGGGVSTIFPVPAWQVAAGCIAEGSAVIQNRGVPDVAGSADPSAGYTVRADGQVQPIGGTSAVAPLYAGLLARIAPALNGQIPLLLPVLYQNGATLFNDIVKGNNSIHGVQGYDARPGWDACTGLGSPKGQAISDILTK
jgi:kumamolisin